MAAPSRGAAITQDGANHRLAATHSRIPVLEHSARIVLEDPGVQHVHAERRLAMAAAAPARSRARIRLVCISFVSFVSWVRYSAVTRLITARSGATCVAGKPPRRACSRPSGLRTRVRIRRRLLSAHPGLSPRRPSPLPRSSRPARDPLRRCCVASCTLRRATLRLRSQ